MSIIDQAGSFNLGDRTVKRLGYGAMQLAGPGVFGPPRDHGAALAVLREAVASGVNHVDTSDFYGPHVTNRIIREPSTPIAMISSSSPRSARGAAPTDPGFRPSRGKSLRKPYTITSGTSA
ncbi:aldo/keto reductase domain-containing protein (plasmid) [Rhizobium phaseoli]|nr:aldo/keto reductase domain-containing protein [Rhizobium phaseoli]ANM00387.1 aldo/keto reductase domain-containing protein [Rhizobium phaseoli]